MAIFEANRSDDAVASPFALPNFPPPVFLGPVVSEAWVGCSIGPDVAASFDASAVRSFRNRIRKALVLVGNVRFTRRMIRVDSAGSKLCAEVPRHATRRPLAVSWLQLGKRGRAPHCIPPRPRAASGHRAGFRTFRPASPRTAGSPVWFTRRLRHG